MFILFILEINRAINAVDFNEIYDIPHKYQSSAALPGLLDIVNHLQDIENFAEQQKIIEVKSVYNKLLDAFKIIKYSSH